MLLIFLLDAEGNQELGNAPQLGTILFKHQCYRLIEVVDKVPAVGNLNGLWSAGRGRCRVVSTSITTDHPNVRMRASTRRWRFQRHGLVTGQ